MGSDSGMYPMGNLLPPTPRSHSWHFSPLDTDLARDIACRTSPSLVPWKNFLNGLLEGRSKNLCIRLLGTLCDDASVVPASWILWVDDASVVPVSGILWVDDASVVPVSGFFNVTEVRWKNGGRDRYLEGYHTIVTCTFWHKNNEIRNSKLKIEFELELLTFVD